MKNIISFLWETTKVIIIALLIVIPVRYFLFQPFVVSGESMKPTYNNGDYLIVESISYKIRDPLRGEVIVFYYPENPSFRHIKRIIGMPNEKIIIDNNRIEITDLNEDSIILNESDYLSFFESDEREEFLLEDDEYFVMGDNRSASFDSRKWGSLPRDHIIGRTAVRVFPLSNFEIIDIPNY